MAREAAEVELVTVDYNAAEGVRWSRLKAMMTSPLQYQYEMTHPRQDSVSLRIGRAVHAIVLEGMESFRAQYAIYGGSRRGKAWTEFEAAHADQDILTGTEAARAQNCADAVLNDPVARRHLREGLAEQIIQWDDPETGLRCKCRADLVNGHLVELKSTKDPDPDAFARDAYRYLYHGQLAFYRDGIVESGYPLDHDPALITVGTSEPHDVVVYDISDDIVDKGRKLYRGLLDNLARCLTDDRWPGIADGNELNFALPPWASRDEEPVTFGGEAILT